MINIDKELDEFRIACKAATPTVKEAIERFNNLFNCNKPKGNNMKEFKRKDRVTCRDMGGEFVFMCEGLYDGHSIIVRPKNPNRTFHVLTESIRPVQDKTEVACSHCYDISKELATKDFTITTLKGQLKEKDSEITRLKEDTTREQLTNELAAVNLENRNLRAVKDAQINELKGKENTIYKQANIIKEKGDYISELTNDNDPEIKRLKGIISDMKKEIERTRETISNWLKMYNS